MQAMWIAHFRRQHYCAGGAGRGVQKGNNVVRLVGRAARQRCMCQGGQIHHKLNMQSVEYNIRASACERLPRLKQGAL